MADFANVWQTADKSVYSTTLPAVSTANKASPHPPATRAQLELLEEHRFGSGVAYLRYRTQS